MAAHTGNKGTGTFIRQRVTGVINIVLVGFLIWLVVRLAGADRAQMVATFSHPLVWIPTIVLIAAALLHMRIGMHEVILDYVHEPRLLAFSTLLNTVFTVMIGIIAAISVLVLAFGG